MKLISPPSRRSFGYEGHWRIQRPLYAFWIEQQECVPTELGPAISSVIVERRVCESPPSQPALHHAERLVEPRPASACVSPAKNVISVAWRSSGGAPPNSACSASRCARVRARHRDRKIKVKKSRWRSRTGYAGRTNRLPQSIGRASPSLLRNRNLLGLSIEHVTRCCRRFGQGIAGYRPS